MANKIPRVPVREQDPAVRARNFEEVCYGYNEQEAVLEASRCLNCKKPRCVEACPVSIQIPAFISKVAAGDIKEAARIISQDSGSGRRYQGGCPHHLSGQFPARSLRPCLPPGDPV